MTWLVETDVILAAINSRDPMHGEARSLISRLTELYLSPYTLIEIDLLIRSGILRVSNVEKFWQKLAQALRYHEIEVMPPKPEHHREAHRLREERGLTYFDSLHAAAAIVGGLTLVSYDEKAYRGVPGLRYRHPAEVGIGP